MIRIMFYHVSFRLDYIYIFNPPIIYRDIKPLNILYCFGKYLISDFNIAKTVNNLHTLSKINSYMPLEL
jgi:serine/threonine protein kinase